MLSFIFTIQRQEGLGRESIAFWLTPQVGVGELKEKDWALVFGIHTILNVISSGVFCFLVSVPLFPYNPGQCPEEAESGQHTRASVPVL